MTSKEHLVEQRILEYESRLKRIDELFSQATQIVQHHDDTPDILLELAQLRKDREILLAHIEEMKQKNLQEWQEASIEEGGPMIIWEAVAKKLEKLIERIEA